MKEVPEPDERPPASPNEHEPTPGHGHRRRPELAVRNLQRRHSVDRRALAGFLRSVSAELDERGREATLALVNDERMRQLNREYRGLDETTDVLSFRADSPYLGDIVISVETADRQARRRGSTLARELRVLTLHGFLHLLGYDHETDDGEMRRVEYRLRRKMRLTTPRGHPASDGVSGVRKQK